MKKMFIFSLLLALSISLCACQEPAPHVHTYESEWSHDTYEHWHKASCEHAELESGRAEHFFEGSVKVKETCTEPGVHILTCEECGFSTEITVDPAHRYEDGVCAECGEAEPTPEA